MKKIAEPEDLDEVVFAARRLMDTVDMPEELRVKTEAVKLIMKIIPTGELGVMVHSELSDAMLNLYMASMAAKILKERGVDIFKKIVEISTKK